MGWNDYGARFYDPAVGRWMTIDPLSEKYVSDSPYNYVTNNPLKYTDPTGMSSQSTHTDKDGNVVGVYNDGDNGVYMHEDWKKDKKNYSILNTSGNGKKMGETAYWDEFATHDANGNIVSDKEGNFRNKDAKINFGQSYEAEMQVLVQNTKDNMKWQGSLLKALEWLKTSSRRGNHLDIKDKIGHATGYLFKGYYVSGESLGNYLFGENLKNLKILYANMATDMLVFDEGAKKFGAYHNESNKVNNPSIPPYYGEIPYSGRNISLGFWGNNYNNPIFIKYGSAAYYGKVINNGLMP